MSVVVDLRGREVLDSRGYPTVEAEVRLESGVRARAMVPSGASTGRHEALELRDGDPARYRGRGVRKAVSGLSGEIREALEGMEAGDQAAVDRRLVELDGTGSKERLGANALLAASMAVARAAAWETGRPLYLHLHSLREGEDPTLPVPLVNVLNGGSHAPNSLEIQEFMVVPVGFRRFSRALRAGVEVFHVLRERLAEEGHATAVGDEGGVAPDLASNEEALDYLMAAVEAAGYRPGEEIFLALDCAATEFHDGAEGVYRPEEGEPPVGTEELVELYQDWSGRYPLVSLEDGLAEDDWEGWVLLTERLGDRLQIVGDDLFVTNVDRIRRGIRQGAANALLVKLNQIGTVSETLDAMAVAREAGYANVVSHRSGETEDTFIADLAVGTAAGQIKTGSTCRSERVAKYNRLLRIQEELGESAGYAGRDAFGTEAVRG